VADERMGELSAGVPVGHLLQQEVANGESRTTLTPAITTDSSPLVKTSWSSARMALT
jgi:hypothetical protein